MKTTRAYFYLLGLVWLFVACGDCEDKWPRTPIDASVKTWLAPFQIGKVFTYSNGKGDVYSIEILNSQISGWEISDIYQNLGWFDCPDGKIVEKQTITLKLKKMRSGSMLEIVLNIFLDSMVTLVLWVCMA
ncbi:MAG: hypothetical protein MUE85_09685 [Microscillaceae bacterium]|jgi:hypothetical protein|nr:hypothetical protein [Microscillaceae bacterium]